MKPLLLLLRSLLTLISPVHTAGSSFVDFKKSLNLLFYTTVLAVCSTVQALTCITLDHCSMSCIILLYTLVASCCLHVQHYFAFKLVKIYVLGAWSPLTCLFVYKTNNSIVTRVKSIGNHDSEETLARKEKLAPAWYRTQDN